VPQLVNCDGPRAVARAARAAGARTVYYSTDYVFGGEHEGKIYTEDDAVGPVNVYGGVLLRDQGLGFMVWGTGFRVQGLGFGVCCLMCRSEGSGCTDWSVDSWCLLCSCMLGEDRRTRMTCGQTLKPLPGTLNPKPKTLSSKP
jgi:hypothetical protein